MNSEKGEYNQSSSITTIKLLMTQLNCQAREATDQEGNAESLGRNDPGARFSKVPIINGPGTPGKLLPFTLKMEVSIVLHLTL